MNSQHFYKLLDERIEKMKATLVSKGDEYSTDGDKLYNFKQAGIVNGVTQEEALWYMMTKHLVSVQDMVFGVKPKSVKLVDEKIGDLINYLVLLEAIFREELGDGQ